MSCVAKPRHSFGYVYVLRLGQCEKDLEIIQHLTAIPVLTLYFSTVSLDAFPLRSINSPWGSWEASGFRVRSKCMMILSHLAGLGQYGPWPFQSICATLAEKH